MVRFYAIKLFATFSVIFWLFSFHHHAMAKSTSLWFENWYEIRLSGQRVGNSHVKGYVFENKKIPYLRLEYRSKFQMKRNGQAIEYTSSGEAIANALSLQPVSFENQEVYAGVKKKIVGKPTKKGFQIIQQLGNGETITQTIQITKNTIIDEHLGFYLAKQISHKNFPPISELYIINTSEGFLETAIFTLVQENQKKNELVLTGKIGHYEITSAYNFEGKLIWSETPALETRIESVSSDDAEAPFEMVDSYDSSRILVEKTLPSKLRSLTLKMSVSQGWKPALNDFSNWKRQNDSEWIITTTLDNDNIPSIAIEQLLKYKDNQTLQQYLVSTLQEPLHPKLKEIAQMIIKDSKTVYEAAEKLNKWVFSYVSKKNFSKIYAGALETLDTKEGDCTEHSVLLSALAKNAGIPSKIIDGLVYHDGAFIFHEWVELYIDRWRSFDPTLNQNPIDVTHIKITESTTDPQSRQPGIYAIGRLRTRVSIEVIQYKK